MINLLKMEMNRFFTNKMMYILLLVFIAFQIFGIFMIKQYEEPGAGILLIGEMNESQFIQSMLSQTPSWVMIYIMVFTVYFYLSEYHAGFYKNYISMKNARTYAVISKIIILGLFTLLMFLAMFVANQIGRSIFTDTTALGDFGYFITLILGQFLLHWAFAVVVLCIAMLVKNMISGIVLGFVLALNVFGSAVAFLESLIWDMNLSAYLLINTIVTPLDLDNLQGVTHMFSVALIVLFLFSFIAITYKKKEDLK